jgi:hypothetical protein
MNTTLGIWSSSIMIFGYITVILHRKLNTVSYLLKATAVKPAETAVTELQLHKQAHFHGNDLITTIMGSGVFYVVRAKMS